MAQSLARILIHVVFATKGRYPYITDDVREELHAYAATTLRSADSPALIVNSIADHMHVLFTLAKTRTLSDVVQELKASTSRWIKSKGGMLTKFQWQAGYGAFSVSQSQVAAVRTYIAEQAEHHQRVTFEEELRALFRKHEIVFDEQYVWD